ncbi:MAG TPA: D-alanyl-D-alanine carboxypeptidase/D-alanyl-D-alanine-endopeptidase [Longimicrobium sp.]|nr:D-alanyl-D-alanine carboxypeptidase/D-alanyl-D-alanine-endopeptidase [Longimicrobium sp.]
MAERIDAVLDRPALRRAHWGIEVRDAASGRVLYARDADRLFIPASNLKLIVTATAAHHLDPTFRYRTSLYATGPVAEGTLAGDVVLYGRGDPLISARGGRDRLAVFEAFADSLLARGVRRVAGGVVADESFFDGDHLRGDWEADDLLWWYAAPVSALGFNDNSIDVRIAPGSAPGRAARVTFEPRTDYVTLVNAATTVAAGRARTVDLERLPGRGRLRAYGQVPANALTDIEYFAVDDPARFAGTVFREVLERKGIAVEVDSIRVVTDPAQSPADSTRLVAEHRSDLLAAVIGPILKNSQNWFAEQLVKTLGRELRGEGSWDAGLAVEREFLTREVGIDSADFVLRDASGLSAGNLVTPRALVQLLDYIRRTPGQEAVRRGLPVAGGEGSLQARFPELPGRVTAKTGYIGNVDSLSGFVTLQNGRVVIFSIIANQSGQSTGRMKAGIDDVVRAIAGEGR